MSQKTLLRANGCANDEFYTLTEDIEKEVMHYADFLNGKIVYCNCDNPYTSNFVKYFAEHFQQFGLKKLIATCYAKPPVKHIQLSFMENKEETVCVVNRKQKAYLWEMCPANHGEDFEQILNSNPPVLLKGSGDFRSRECRKILSQADVIITNPPFSLIQDYMTLLTDSGKFFLVLACLNAVTLKNIKPMILQQKFWFGQSIHGGGKKFIVPDYYPVYGYNNNAGRFVNVSGVRWFTNIDYPQRHIFFSSGKRYSPEQYPQYDNYPAINVNKVSEIPTDYDGVIGVPITFMDKYCPEQFELLGIENKLRIGEKSFYYRILIRRKQST